MADALLDATTGRAGAELPRLGWGRRLFSALGTLAGLRRHDFRAARTFVRSKFGEYSFLPRWWHFTGWALRQLFCVMPDALQHVSFAARMSRTPIWLAHGNPLADHPWAADPKARLPERADTVVIGAGFTGGALAFHWSRKAPAGRRLVVLDMGDPAGGSSGRNEGLVVMGRYYHMVHATVRNHLPGVRPDLSDLQRDRLARQFAAAYCRAAYKNADLIEQTIKAEGFECDYAREGWVQAQDAEGQKKLEESVHLALETGFTDWTRISAEEVLSRTGMRVKHNAGFSLAAASFHPAKWVWSLLRAALDAPNVCLYTRTRVNRVEGDGDDYVVHTARGSIRARHVVNATESYTPLLHRQFHDVIRPTQTQAASGAGGPEAMKPRVGISGTWFFCGRHGDEVMIGSDATRVPDREAGRIQPSRFLTRFLCGELKRYFGPFRLHLTHEWSGTVGYTPDEYPVVGVMDGKRQYVIGGMAGSGTGVSFNAARCVCNRILGVNSEPDDYPAEYFAPSRLLDPAGHPWPSITSV